MSSLSSCILIKVSFFDPGESLLKSNVQGIKNIVEFCFSSKRDANLFQNALHLIDNLTSQNEDLRIYFVSEGKLLDFFTKICCGNDCFIDAGQISYYLMKCIVNLIDEVSKFDAEKYVKLVKFAGSKLYNGSETLFLACYLIYKLLRFDHKEIIEEVLSLNIDVDLMNVYPFEDNDCIFNIEGSELKYARTQNRQNYKATDSSVDYVIKIKEGEVNQTSKYLNSKRLSIIKSLGLLAGTPSSNTHLNSHNVSKFVNRALQTTDIKLVKNLAYLMSNMASCTIQDFMPFVENKTVFYFRDVVKFVYEAMFEPCNKENVGYYKFIISALREIGHAVNSMFKVIFSDTACELSFGENCLFSKVLLDSLDFDNWSETGRTWDAFE